MQQCFEDEEFCDCQQAAVTKKTCGTSHVSSCVLPQFVSRSRTEGDAVKSGESAQESAVAEREQKKKKKEKGGMEFSEVP